MIWIATRNLLQSTHKHVVVSKKHEWHSLGASSLQFSFWHQQRRQFYHVFNSFVHYCCFFVSLARIYVNLMSAMCGCEIWQLPVWSSFFINQHTKEKKMVENEKKNPFPMAKKNRKEHTHNRRRLKYEYKINIHANSEQCFLWNVSFLWLLAYSRKKSIRMFSVKSAMESKKSFLYTISWHHIGPNAFFFASIPFFSHKF